MIGRSEMGLVRVGLLEPSLSLAASSLLVTQPCLQSYPTIHPEAGVVIPRGVSHKGTKPPYR